MSYLNWVYVYAIYYGILRAKNQEAPPFSITEKAKDWIRSKCQPGNLLKSLEYFLFFFIGIYIIVDLTFGIPVKYWLVSQGIYAVFCMAAFKVAQQYDPRKPSDQSRVDLTRVVSFLMQVFFLGILVWSQEIVIKQISINSFVYYVIAVYTAIFGRFFAIIIMITKETNLNVRIPLRFFSQECRIPYREVIFEGIVFILFFVLLILNLRFPDTRYESVIFSVLRVFLFASILMNLHLVFGKYRESVRQQPPADIQPPIPLANDTSVYIEMTRSPDSND
jgi:hypothetical protein